PRTGRGGRRSPSSARSSRSSRRTRRRIRRCSGARRSFAVARATASRARRFSFPPTSSPPTTPPSPPPPSSPPTLSPPPHPPAPAPRPAAARNRGLAERRTSAEASEREHPALGALAGDVYAEQGDKARALSAFRRALVAKPGDPYVLRRMAALETGEGRIRDL